MSSHQVNESISARSINFLFALRATANRSLKVLPRDLALIIPTLFIPIFFYLVTIGALSEVTSSAGELAIDYKAFQLPLAIIMAVTGVSRAGALVIDVQQGYFNRLMLTPLNRYSILLGLMVADLVVFVILTVPVVLLGLAIGVRFETGILGVLVFIGLSALWGMMYSGFPYAMALLTGNPTAVNNTFLLFFPFMFLTSAWVPRENLSGWLDTFATWNPVTYILEGLRSLLVDWDGSELGKAFLAVIGIGIVAQGLAFWSLRKRSQTG